MDPFSALSLACAIVQFVDFGSKLIKGTTEIYGSTAGATSQDESLKFVTEKLKALTFSLYCGASSPQSALEKGLQELAEECRKLSKELLDHLKKTTAKDSSLIESAAAAWKSAWYGGDKKDLVNRLESCEKQLHLHLTAIMR